MKEELLEHLVRYCVREILRQRMIDEGIIPEEEEKDDTIGAPAPPADGQGTGDQPPVPKKKEPQNTEPEEPETPKKDEPEQTPEKPESPSLKGITFVNPRDKAKLQKLNFAGMNDVTLTQALNRVAKTMGGPNAKTAANTVTAVKDAAKNPNTSLYLYLGKYDPNSGEVFLMADKSLQVAKDSSATPADVQGMVPQQIPVAPQPKPEPQQPAALNENVQKTIRRMVCQILEG